VASPARPSLPLYFGRSSEYPQNSIFATFCRAFCKNESFDRDLSGEESYSHGMRDSSNESTKPVVLVATGTGFAPVKSIVEDALKRKLARPLHLYWGTRRAKDLYLAELAEKWQESGKLKFVPVLSEPHEGWDGRSGLVHRAVLEDFASLAHYQVYACGNPAMTRAARETFLAAGLSEDDVFSDAFVHTAAHL
jgi:ferredoxin-NADP reductase